MKYLYTFLLCFLCAVGTGYGLQIEATPTTLVIGLTTTLEVTCHTFINSSTQMESLISLIITRSGHGPSKELASINVFSPGGHVVDVSNETLTGSGKIDNMGESYLHLAWRFPDVNKRGIYACVAHGVSHTGHPVTLTSTISVNSSNPATGQLVNEIHNLTLELDTCETKYLDLSEVLFEFKNMSLEFETFKANLDLIKTNMFSISPPYNGHHYLLSNRLHTYDVKSGEALCELFGGYLVEINSRDEHQFLINFLTNENNKLVFNAAMTGLSDELQENVWVNRHSKTVANYTHWYSGEPSGGQSQNCVVLYSTTMLMIDDPCAATMSDNSFKLTYLCEVPDQKPV
ncbi:uncharacterized protein LOC131934572 [Physella acuta]|uniref:uncharacterized protein LOC131934572 n=1 Tax=Physella acuta TaxID=109671 RepID=UPI0027DDE331|nr:uncharacterized protein LOC131934572 [Physella acuta]